MKDLFAKCGVNCGHCPGYRKNAKTDEARQRCSDGWYRYLGARLKPERCYCDGCQAPDPWKSGNILPVRSCVIRKCAIKTGVETCAHCSAYPCGVQYPDIDGERIASRIGAPIPEEDYLTFIEPYEGLKHLNEIRASLDPEDIVEKVKVKPLKAKIVAFPENLPFSQEETMVFKTLHKLLEKILSAYADTCAQQMLLKRRKPHILGLLWVVGFYGELKKENGTQLVLDGTTYEDKWLVRKYDTTLHTYVVQSFRFLKDFGVQGEFEPLKKGWLLRLSFNESAGGVAALKALKRYTTSLVKKYSEPVYAGNTRYKGEAFTLFSKADMRVLMKEVK